VLDDLPNTRYVSLLPGTSSGLKYFCWDDECVVFVPGAGDTLMLTRIAWQVLSRICADHPDGISLTELLEGLGCGIPDDELVSLLKRSLEQFESRQLIESRTI
jgi:hypothetical protein